jgi:hypothetical protein
MQNLDDISINKAIDRFVEELKTDPEFYRGWKDNIAMAFKDAYQRDWGGSEQAALSMHHLANKAADNFLQSLFIDTQK